MGASALNTRGPTVGRTYIKRSPPECRSTLWRLLHVVLFTFIALIFSVNVAVAGTVLTSSEEVGAHDGDGSSEIEHPVMLDETLRSLALLQTGNSPNAHHVMLDETLRSLMLQAISSSTNTSAQSEAAAGVMICISCADGFFA